MTLYCNGKKVCPTKTIIQGDVDSGGQYLVKVIDYDGTILKQDHLNSGSTFELPEPPTNHERLTFQTWSSPLQITNNTITVGKSDVTIGAVYTTKSGLNEYVVELSPATGLTVSMGFDSHEKSWGDGTTDSLGSHTYSDYGTYIIKSTSPLDVNTGIVTFKEVNLAQAGSQGYIYYKCLNGLSIANTTDGTNDGYFSIRPYTLKSLIFPPSLTSITDIGGGYIVLYSLNLQDVVFPYGLKNFTVGNYTALRLINNTTNALKKITFPATIEAIPQIFYYVSNATQVYALEELNFTEHTFVPTLGNYDTPTNQARLCINKSLKIRVPKSLESQWKTATNWSAWADYIVGVE